MFYSDNCFSFTSTLADAMCSMDVSRSPDSLVSHLRFPYHVPPARVLVRSRSHFTCFPYCTNVDCRLVPGYLFVFCFSFCVVDSSTYVSRLCRSPFISSTRLSPHYLWTLTRFPFLCLCTCISHTAIYTGWRCGLVPHLQSTLQPP